MPRLINQITLNEFQRVKDTLPSPSEFKVNDFFIAPLIRRDKTWLINHAIVDSSIEDLAKEVTTQQYQNEAETTEYVYGVRFYCKEFCSGKHWVFDGQIIVVPEIADLEQQDLGREEGSG